MFGLQISQNIGCDFQWTVRKKWLDLKVLKNKTAICTHWCWRRIQQGQLRSYQSSHTCMKLTQNVTMPVVMSYRSDSQRLVLVVLVVCRLPLVVWRRIIKSNAQTVYITRLVETFFFPPGQYTCAVQFRCKTAYRLNTGCLKSPQPKCFQMAHCFCELGEAKQWSTSNTLSVSS